MINVGIGGKLSSSSKLVRGLSKGVEFAGLGEIPETEDRLWLVVALEGVSGSEVALLLVDTCGVGGTFVPRFGLLVLGVDGFAKRLWAAATSWGLPLKSDPAVGRFVRSRLAIPEFVGLEDPARTGFAFGGGGLAWF